MQATAAATRFSAGSVRPPAKIWNAIVPLYPNPIAGIEDIDTSTHFTYSEGQPNSRLVEEVPVFLAGIRR
ncbi:MAG TPA: hypothetical protein VGD55_00515, partial [Acidothermaceae bacterium]